MYRNLALCLLCSTLAAGCPTDDSTAMGLDWNDNTAQFKTSQRVAYIGFTMKWGGHRPMQKYLVVQSVMPQFNNTPLSALTGTHIPFNNFGDLNPLGWSRRNQVLTLLGIGTTIWIIENNSHGHGSHYGVATEDEEEEDDEEDSDEDSDFPEHCYDGNGSDGEYNKFCF